MKKINTATITWISWNNFGSLLQAFALQQILLKLGVRNKILCDKRFAIPKISLRKRIKKLKNIILRKNINPSDTMFTKFRKRFLQIDTTASYSTLNKRYDIFICGSDQIWSPYLKHEPYYYLRYFSKKKVAYAPSIGTCSFSEEYVKTILGDLRQFAHLSAREGKSASKLSAMSGLSITEVLDPTLLLDSSDWEKLLVQQDTTESYVLCYFLSPNQWYMDYVAQYAKKHHLSIKIFNTHKQYSDYAEAIPAGPCEFLSYINSAQIVFTDSYHASIFSILFRKKFFTFKRFVDDGDLDQNERIYNLFNHLGLQSYFIGMRDTATIDELPDIEYDSVEKTLSTLRLNSIQFLKQAISQ
ncbi:MAG: polysaccharide pyruvyl transferase family protein [Akkermansia sp.]|nr:polysaccharide pyruvyl transferase family protein [Akkermansia sp.]